MIVPRVPLAVLLMGGVACATVQPVRDPAQFISKANPPVVFVTYKNRSIMPVAQPRVSGDSLFGTWQGVNEQVAVPLSRVQRIEAVQPNGQRTVLLIAGLAVVTAGAVWTFSLLSEGKEICDYSGVTSQTCTPMYE